MNTEANRETTALPRLWPLMAVVVLQAALLAVSVTPSINNFLRFVVMMLVPGVAGILALVWLLALSRLRWSERIILPLAVVALAAAVAVVCDQSVWTAMWAYGLPMTVFLVAAAVWLGRRSTAPARLALVLPLLAVGWGSFTLVRLDGMDGAYLPEFAWRWAPTAEEAVIAAARPRVDAEVASVTVEAAEGDWPGFRGPGRNSRDAHARPDVAWTTNPPTERWRIPIGPGWGSLAHVGGRLFTLEQRGELEAIVCLDAATGAEIWRHEYATRFTEVVSGAGPRSTPTFADGRVYATGAKGMLTCLDASSGSPHWQHDLMAELDAPLPMWAFSASPLVVGDRVIVYADGRDDHGLVAYDRRTGDASWHMAATGMNYASAQLVTIAGVELVLFTGGSGLIALDPQTGGILWRFEPEGWRGAPMIQPQSIGDGDLVVALGDGIGIARLRVERRDDAWAVEEVWSSRRMKPSFNDFVHHEGYLYGFDQSVFTCIDAATGAVAWRRGRYGFGQVLLLESVAALVVMAEEGEVVLLAADPTGHRELGRVAAMEGKTWNHPIVAGGRLFVRNGEEVVCFDLPDSPGSASGDVAEANSDA